MNKFYFLFVIFFFSSVALFAQTKGGVSIGKDGEAAHEKAILELVSTNKGLLIPRMTSAERNQIFGSGAVDSSAKGLMVYDTTQSAFFFWDGGAWKTVASANARVVSGPPTGTAVVGDLAFDAQNSALYVYSGTAWVRTGGASNGASFDPSWDNQTLYLGTQDGRIVKIGVNAENVKVTPTNDISSTNVQAALVELQSDINNLSANSGLTSVFTDNATIVGNGTSTSRLSIPNNAINSDRIQNGAVTLNKIFSNNEFNKVMTTNTAGTVIWEDRANFGGTVPDGSITGIKIAANTITQDKLSLGTPTFYGQPLVWSAWGLTYGSLHIDAIGATGTKNATTFLRGDGTWATISAGTTLPPYGASDANKVLSVNGTGTDVMWSTVTSGGAISLAGQNYLSLAGTTLTANPVDLSGTHVTGLLAPARFPALTGDVTTVAGSVATAIANNAVTNTKIADGAVTTSKILDRTILPADLSSMGATTAGQVLQWDGTNWGAATVSGGGITSLSVASANGFTGTSSGGATPALTLGTSVNGLLRGNGTAISAAVAGTDYIAPGASSITIGTLANAVTLSAPTANSGAYNLVLPTNDGTADYVLKTDGNGVLRWDVDATGAAGGGITSIGLSLPLYNAFPTLTADGSFTGTLSTQTANRILAGPSSGGAAAPTFRALVADDIPALDWAKITTGKPTTLAGYGIMDAVLNPMSATGDIIYRGASGAPTRLAAGTNGHVLTLSGGVPTWAAATGGAGVSSITGTANQITASASTGAVTLSLPATISGLTSVAATTFTGALSGNATTATNISGGTAGQILYQSAANTTAKLPVGTNGHVLTLSGGVPTWAAATGGTTNLGYTPAASTGTVTSSSGTGATLPAATTSAAGLLTAADKTKLDGIAANANNYTLPTASTTTLGGVRVDGTTITIASGVISAAGGGVMSVSAEQTGNYTALATDDVILFNVTSSGITLTLPTTGIPVGKTYYVSNRGNRGIALSPLPRDPSTQTLFPGYTHMLIYIGGTGNGSYVIVAGS